MKTTLLTLAFVAFLFSTDSKTDSIYETQQFTKKGKLEITVSYEKQSGTGSNQYAIWIENAQGQIVKTIFVTKFTAQGGYSYRPDCTPMWVNKAKPAEMSKQRIDAFSGATPQSGNHTYVWDMTDDMGNQVAAGEYTFYVEATLLAASKVTFKGAVVTGDSKVSVEPKPEFSSNDSKNKGMIKSVKATYLPAV